MLVLIRNVDLHFQQAVADDPQDKQSFAEQPDLQVKLSAVLNGATQLEEYDTSLS